MLAPKHDVIHVWNCLEVEFRKSPPHLGTKKSPETRFKFKSLQFSGPKKVHSGQRDLLGKSSREKISFYEAGGDRDQKNDPKPEIENQISSNIKEEIW